MRSLVQFGWTPQEIDDQTMEGLGMAFSEDAPGAYDNWQSISDSKERAKARIKSIEARRRRAEALGLVPVRSDEIEGDAGEDEQG